MVDAFHQRQKDDLKEIGDKVVAYAKTNSWDNDYYLYVTFSYGTTTQTIYDYETGKIYIPNVDNLYVEMYEQFGTFSDYEVEKLSDGTDWLASKGLGKYKHGEYENNSDALDSMYIWCYKGKFSIRNSDKSTAY